MIKTVAVTKIVPMGISGICGVPPVVLPVSDDIDVSLVVYVGYDVIEGVL